MNKVLVIGSNSFAGSATVNFLLDHVDQVIGVSRSENPHPILLSYATHENRNIFSFEKMNINTDFQALFQLINKAKPNIVIDFAGQGMVAESWKNPEEWYNTNIISKIRLHQFLKNCDFLEKYVRISTPEVYGSVNHPVLENQSYNPSTPYAVSHAAIDMSLMAFYKEYQFPVIIDRFANFFGPHQQLYRIIPRAIIYILLGKKLQLHGGGISKRAFIYHSDVAHAIWNSIKLGRTGEIYHFSGSEVISIADLIKMICQLLSVRYEDVIEIVPDRRGKDLCYELDCSKTMKELHWRSQITLSEGIENTVQWIKDNFSTIKTLPLEYIHKT